ncbi:MAG: Rv2732c family membrane protein [Sciscionella sp.]
MQGLRAQIDEVGKRSEHTFDPGGRAVGAAVAMLILLLAVALPFSGGLSGWHLLFGQDPATKVASIAPKVFLVVALLFGVLGTVVALSVRRYGAAWITSLGCDLSVLFGGLSIWSQQTSSSHHPGPGPGIGMLLAELSMVAFAVIWAGITWKRSPTDQHPQIRLTDE